jgi:hypothetical protein
MDERKAMVWEGQSRGDYRIKKANSFLSAAHYLTPLHCAVLSAHFLSRRDLECTAVHPLSQSAVTSKAELYGLCVRTIGVSGEAEILLNASRHIL